MYTYGLVVCGQDDLEPVPCEAAITGVALLIPRLVGAEQRPGRVVKTGAGPAQLTVRVVAGMEAPQVMNLHNGLAFLLKVDDLCSRQRESRRRQQQSRNA
jgi:hypothetical protein